MFDQKDENGEVIDDQAKLFSATKNKYPYKINYCEMPQIGIDYDADAKANAIQQAAENDQIDSRRAPISQLKRGK